MPTNRAFRWMFYMMEFALLFIVQSTPGFFPTVGGVRPILLVPAALSVALFEGDMGGMVAGMVCGLMVDFGYGDTLGFHAILLAVMGYVLGSMTMELFRTNLLVLMIYGLLAIPTLVLAEWVFQYVLMGYDHVGYVLWTHYVPILFYTFLMLPPLYGLNRIIAMRLNEVA